MGGNVYTRRVVGLRIRAALLEAGDLAELAPNLVDHLPGRPAHRVHGEGREQEGEHGAYEQADGHFRGCDVDRLESHRLGKGVEQGECSDRCRSDGESLGDGGRGVAQRVEGVGGLPHLGVEVGHFGNATGVVGDGTVGVHGDRDAESRQHPDSRYGHAVYPASGAHCPLTCIERDPDPGGYRYHREGGRAHSLGHTGDDHGGGPGLRLASDFLDRLVVVRGEPLRNLSDQPADDETGDDCDPDAEPVVHQVAEDDVGEPGHSGGGDDHGEIGSAMECCGEMLLVLRLDQERPDDRSEHAQRGDGEREDDCLGLECRRPEDEGSVCNRSDDGADVGLEEVGAHAGDVTDVVAHVVGDDGRIAGIVLGDTGLDLADQVGADVGGLGVDAAADTGEEGDRRAPKTYGGDDVNPTLLTHDVVEQPKTQSETEQSESGNGEAHHSAPPEGNWERSRDAPGASGLGGAGVGRGCDSHADESGEGRENRTEHICGSAPRCAPVEQGRNEDCHDHDEYRDPGVLALEECHCPFPDGGGQFDHPLVAGGCCQHGAGVVDGQDQAEGTRDERDVQDRVRCHL